MMNDNSYDELCELCYPLHCISIGWEKLLNDLVDVMYVACVEIFLAHCGVVC